MQAIRTVYLPPTNYKPSRIKASCEAGNIIVNWDYEFDTEDNHKQAAMALLDKLEWNPNNMYTGVLQDCYVHVLDFIVWDSELLKEQA